MELFPPIPLSQWQDSKETVHRFAQVVGKIRLAYSARRNHWWNVPYHLTGRGITTRPMAVADGGGTFCIDFDFVDHRLVVCSSDGRRISFPLTGQSVASFYRQTLDALALIGVTVSLPHPHPFDLPDAGRPFTDDTEHAAYDPFWVNRYWQVLGQVNLVLEEFASRFCGKTSPVHHFWHTFDIAVTRFSDHKVDQPPTVDPVTREAYSREVISSGFWFGDDAVPRPTFYSYAAPEPDGLADCPLVPGSARWMERHGSHLAVLDYDDARGSEDPRGTVLGFYESVYRSAARLDHWNVGGEASPGGVTDPVAARAGG
ncbi:DUF5996 family protein [Streptomyces sp. FH025]|uniref:DUF5996 family protein n=1 Tax=Streptomyces sp. FH025 TaxID=2815937 RepID=UPI001A9FE1DB|nr:DUF5996 family protein [Streptomyces sp. FH025]MBO1413031.1 hypothetical protein [Streptomyces sp. FH025]